MTHTLVINDHHLRMLMRSSFPHYTDEERADLLKMFLNSVSAATSQAPLPDAHNLPAWLIKSVENLYTEFMSVQQSIVDKNGMTFDEMFKLRGLIGVLLDKCRGQHPVLDKIVVKQLEWFQTSNMWQAGQYKITRQGIGTYILAGTSAIVRNPWSDLASAKRAAQHDFETETLRRIASPVEPLSDAQIACQELLEAARLIKHVVSYDVLFNAINEAVKLDKTRKVISVEDFRNYISDTVERIIRKAGGGA
jgi:hypothetical protein